ncbi:MAG: UDP-N-acetylmuramoyl-L-alanyl-D-glutamate--2,6-diaminopimelate ligase [Anaerolineae bacterium]|nr:UDP-N-acetylmuramoyl-L-alanyl-D-glutamate--2,6-diaminopimelate ligase [Chloroflexota bacterium]
MKLDDLIAALPFATRLGWSEDSAALEIGAVRDDSREVTAGDLFVAIPGVHVDGHRYVGAAVRAGAAACVVEHDLAELADQPRVVVRDAREALAWLHAALQGHPSHRLRVIGVTGTDGKTTTTRLIASILGAAGLTVGAIDTVAATIAGAALPTGFHTTTPDAPEVQAYLADMVAKQMQYAVIETTSHGLAQHRVAGVAYDVAVVTNITHEHLDYHGSLEAYQQAKAILFRGLSGSYRKPGVDKIAVLNRDDRSFDLLKDIPADRQISYGVRSEADLRARQVVASAQGLQMLVDTPEGTLTISSPLIGLYNVYNILAALATGWSQGIPAQALVEGVARVQGVEGRMERVEAGQPFTAMVDFAHTPNAMEKALETARGLTQGRVIVVFGSAGLRDVAKRAWMGEIAGRLADRVVITAEDPRTEPVEEIMAEIARGCERAGRQDGSDYVRVADRAEAIARALAMALPGDLVIACGKGHEQSMCYGEIEYPWSDRAAVIAGLARLGYHLEGDAA